MKYKHEIVQELREKERHARDFTSTKDSSQDGTYLHLPQSNKSEQNIEYERFKNFFENAPVYGYMVSPEGIILEVNKTALTSLGYKKEELIGKHLSTICATESLEKMKELLLKWKETNEIDNQEIVIVTKQGEKRTVLLCVDSVRDADGKILYFVFIQKDVTEINRIYCELNNNLELQKIKLKQLNEVKTTFLKTTSHELRTPITSIKGYIQMLLKKSIGEIDEEQKKSLEVVLRNTNRLDQIIQNILDASSLKSGIMKFILSKVNPRMLVEEITKAMQSFAYEREMTINVDLEKDLPDLMVDEERIKQVMKNMVDNAIKFSPDGSIINIKARKEKEEILFEVQDNGSGIPKDKQEQIFDGFYQVDSGEDRKFGGAGLSLALSKGIILLHGGNIWVESTEGKGSTFRFTLPIKSICDIKSTDLKNEISPDMHEKSVYFVADSITRSTTDANHPIAEHEKITDALEESEERYRALFNSSFELVYLHDFKGNFIDANPTALKLLDYNKAELSSLNFSSLLDKGQLWKANKTLVEIKKYGRQKEPIEYRVKTKNGTFVDIETTAEIVYRNGEPYAIQGIAHDITERKSAEEVLKESQEKYKRLFDLSPELIIENDEEGNILAINSAMAKSLEVPPEKLIGKNIFDILPREIAKERAKIARKAFEEMKNQESEDKRAGRYFQNIYVPIVHPNGKKTIQLIARDTTNQKKAEETLKANEQKYRVLIENLPQKIFVKDENSTYVSCNENYAHDLKIKSDEIAGRTDYGFYPKELAEKYIADDKRIMESGEMEDLEEKYIQNGQERFVHTIKTPLKDDKGTVFGLLGIFYDITERKKAEKEVIESEEKLRRILDSSPDAITVTDLNGNIIECNQATSMIHGFKKKELIGKNALELFSPKDLERAKEGLKKTLESESVKNLEYTLLTKDGLEFPAELSACLIRDASGNPLSFVAITKDITKRKKIDEMLRISEDRYRKLFEENNDAIFIADPKTKMLIDCNKKAEKLTGYSRQELFSMRADQLHPKDKVEETMKGFEDQTRGLIKSIETEVLTKDGRKVPVSINSSAIDIAEKPCLMGVFRDVTERKKAEEALKENEEKYRNVVERANDGIVIIQDMVIKYVNPRSFDVLGYDPTEMIGALMTNYIHPDELPKVVEYYKRRIAGEDVPRAYESAFVHKDGRRIDVELSGGVITYQGKTADMIMIHDVTEHKKAEKQLKEKIDELEKYKKVTVDREFKMIELKKKIKELEEGVKK